MLTNDPSRFGGVRAQFDEAAARYDIQRRQLIPCFDDFYGIAASLPDWPVDAAFDVLDLGAGTGLFAGMIAARYPQARLTLIDLSDSMLDGARARFRGRANVTIIAGDYTAYPYTQQYDLIISSLSIHHLSDEDKAALYRNVYRLLRDGGHFINADQVLGATDAIDARYKARWRDAVERSGLDRAALDAAYERTKLDRMATLDDQLRWLRDAGFADVDCVYKHYNFVVMAARKASDAAPAL